MLIDSISSSENIVAFTGAGVSTESGIPDFRSSEGIFQMDGEGFPPEVILSRTFFDQYPEKFFEFYKKFMVYRDVKPNRCHIALAKLEEAGKIRAVVTQNIDNLHTEAGSKNVVELHGNANKNYCMKCNKKYGAEYVLNSPSVPKCDSCNGTVRPDVVLYEEMLDEEKLYRAKWYIRDADMVIVIGTSLVVYPAAKLIKYFEGDKLVIINMTDTPFDSTAMLQIRQKAGYVMWKVAEALT
ncbi:MAG TPA: NAD-dependent protein deacylase [Pseudobacteroides sp.]|uniref:NAD-dependent protein deacylase n=1 Tax=Pseudobacteroides sp. TaxID=1968840 RepID=UPI002F92C1BC